MGLENEKVLEVLGNAIYLALEEESSQSQELEEVGDEFHAFKLKFFAKCFTAGSRSLPEILHFSDKQAFWGLNCKQRIAITLLTQEKFTFYDFAAVLGSDVWSAMSIFYSGIEDLLWFHKQNENGLFEWPDKYQSESYCIKSREIVAYYNELQQGMALRPFEVHLNDCTTCQLALKKWSKIMDDLSLLCPNLTPNKQDFDLFVSSFESMNKNKENSSGAIRKALSFLFEIGRVGRSQS